MLQVNIEELTFKAILGILPHERKNKQTIIIDISFEYFYDEKQSNFIDYSVVASDVKKMMKKKKFKLIEDAIIYIRKKLKNKYSMKNLKIKIAKPNIFDNCKVCVQE